MKDNYQERMKLLEQAEPALEELLAGGSSAGVRMEYLCEISRDLEDLKKALRDSAMGVGARGKAEGEEKLRRLGKRAAEQIMYLSWKNSEYTDFVKERPECFVLSRLGILYDARFGEGMFQKTYGVGAGNEQ